MNLVDLIFERSEQEGWPRVLSVGSFYTLTYLIERFLRHQGLAQPQLVERQREILQSLLDVFEIEDLNKEALMSGISDSHFVDLEDSYQCQCAIKSNCSVLLTINKKDFNGEGIMVMTPQEFVDRYIQ